MKKRNMLSLAQSMVLCAVALVFFSGCAVVGLTIPNEKGITLVYNQQVNGTFSDGSLSVDYSYSLSQNRIKLSGNANYSNRMDSLDVRVLFLDVAGTVLKQTVVYSSGYRTDEGQSRNLKFDKTIELPVGVVGISFSSSGQPRRSHR